MKKFIIVLMFLCFTFTSYAEKYGRVFISDGKLINNSGLSSVQKRSTVKSSFFADAINKGVLVYVNENVSANANHIRYGQRYKGLKVFGATIIFHSLENGQTNVTGEYYRKLKDLDTNPLINVPDVMDIYKGHLKKTYIEYETGINKSKRRMPTAQNNAELIVFPLSDTSFKLAYHVTVNKGASFSMNGIIDATTGKLLQETTNIYSAETPEICWGRGLHNAKHKLISVKNSDGGGTYSLQDSKTFRPVVQYTFDYTNSDGNYYYTGSSTSKEFGDRDLVTAHSYLGLVYDYYRTVFNRAGIDGLNLPIYATVHYPGNGDNAFWNGQAKGMYFLDPGQQGWHTASSIDVMAHEYSHGVTQFTSNLLYLSQSGALNEAFSDIMGAAIEFYYHPVGNGVLKADWYMGEDLIAGYLDKGIRNLKNPNDHKNAKPAHLSQYVNLPPTKEGDWGGVHVNTTIWGHAFYLLANGGTNPVSGIQVTGIGIEKATKIYYNVFVNYLSRYSIFIDAANAVVYSTNQLYGNTGSEYASMKRSLEAIGYTFR